MNNTYKMAIFDMDGVILNSEPIHRHVREQMLSEKNLTIADSDLNPVGKSMTEIWDTIREISHIECDSQQMEIEHYRRVSGIIERDKVAPSKGLIELLETARRKNMIIGIASSSPRRLVDDVLRLLHLESYFDITLAGDEVERRKPDPQLYCQVLESYDMSASDAFAVEDSFVGASAAKAAGLFCFGYVNPTSGNQNLEISDRKVYSLTEITESLR